ncbi:MAG: hypothetical protein JW808_09685 [Victivallales bacterium]|nr:hypothetical protein [Victivallales bacterium]
MKALKIAALASVALKVCFAPMDNCMAEEPETQGRPKPVVVTYEPRQVTKIVPLMTVGYATIESVCKPMLSPTGTMAYLPERQSVIVFDFEANAEKIAGVIGKIDLPPVNIRIEVDFVGTSDGRNDKLHGKASYKGHPSKDNQIIIKDGKVVKPDTISISAAKRSDTGTRNTSQFILTRSGSPAQLWVGKTIVDPTWLSQRPLRPTIGLIAPGGGVVIVPGSDNDIVWRDIGSSLYVLPTYLGNGKIDIEVYPVVSYLVDEPEENTAKGRRRTTKRKPRQSVMVEDVSTRMTVQSGQRISMGGVIQSNKNFYTNLFGPDFLGRDDKNSILDMYIRATVVDPAGRPAYDDGSSDDTQQREDPRRLFRDRN